jgi:hypothetical protein
MTQTLTIQIKNNSALKALNSLAERDFIKIVDDAPADSPSLPGSPLSLKAYRNWIADAEHTPTVDLKEAKAKWTGKRKQLQNLRNYPSIPEAGETQGAEENQIEKFPF